MSETSTSDLADRVQAEIIVADFVNVDGSGKANIVGGGVRVFWMAPGSPATDPFGVLVLLETPTPIDESPAFELLVTTSTGLPVTVPTPDGNKQAVRVAMNIDFVNPSLPGVKIPKGALPSTFQFALNFSNGLPLKPGYSYQVRVQLDHDVVASYSFFVAPSAPQAPVVG